MIVGDLTLRLCAKKRQWTQKLGFIPSIYIVNASFHLIHQIYIPSSNAPVPGRRCEYQQWQFRALRTRREHFEPLLRRHRTLRGPDPVGRDCSKRTRTTGNPVIYFIINTNLQAHRYRTAQRKDKRPSHPDPNGILSMRAQLPMENEFVDILRKFKLSFNLLAKLKSHIHEPNAPELLHFLFTPLAIILDTCHRGLGRNIAPQVGIIFSRFWKFGRKPFLSSDWTNLTMRKYKIWPKHEKLNKPTSDEQRIYLWISFYPPIETFSFSQIILSIPINVPGSRPSALLGGPWLATELFEQ